MKKYALLVNPGHNRVYFQASKSLSLSELTVCGKAMETAPVEIKGEYIEDVFYLTFETEPPLTERDMEIISRLSFVFAVYELIKNGGEVFLKPVCVPSSRYIDGNLSGILKYTGKTNEIFTRMMINVALFSTEKIDLNNIKILDPIAGKGTTLFEGLICGYNVYGIEIGEKAAAESYQYLKKYLETEKYKHTISIQKQSGENKSFTAKKYAACIGKTKEDFKNSQRHWEIVAGNSLYADKYFKKNSFDIIVGDLPYGVQHGNVTMQGQSSFTRNPKELVKACLPAWKKVLKLGGAMVLSWNTFIFPKEQFAHILENAGFKVLNDGVYSTFEHRVDQSIKRDIIVAVKIGD